MPNRRRDQSGRLARALSVIAGLGLVVGAVAAILFSVLVATTRADIARSNRILLVGSELLSDMKDLETGERGYVITADPNYLAPYYASESVLDSELARLEIPDAQRAPLTREVTAKRAFAREVIDSINQNGEQSARALILSGRDKMLMDQVRTTVHTIQNNASEDITRKERRQSRWSPVLQLIGAVGFSVAFLAVLTLAILRRRAERASIALLSRVMDNAPTSAWA
ncbi:CHASE3 domain-containing protein [Terriglobus aquaticus]|uniref:CHASE3 domain-containing protein n=1 Tax=Terriglobus aquaticus TaxID=940139 RepID=A0ABW9KLB0_9BACT